MAAPRTSAIIELTTVASSLGSTSTATRVAPGRRSRSSPSRFDPISAVMEVTPVMLPPGWSRLETRPVATGSAPKTKTIGIVVVAVFAARIAGTLPDATRTATPRSTRSLAQSGSLARWDRGMDVPCATLGLQRDALPQLTPNRGEGYAYVAPTIPFTRAGRTNQIA